MKPRKAIKELDGWRTNRSDIRFERFCAVVEHFGFRCRGGKGSHKVYVREGVVENLSVQEVNGKAKPYQIRQFIDLVDRYNLEDLEKPPEGTSGQSGDPSEKDGSSEGNSKSSLTGG